VLVVLVGFWLQSPYKDAFTLKCNIFCTINVIRKADAAINVITVRHTHTQRFIPVKFDDSHYDSYPIISFKLKSEFDPLSTCGLSF